MNPLRSSTGGSKSSPSSGQASPVVAVKPPRRRRNTDAEGGGPKSKKQKGTSSAARQSSIIGVTRSISACLRCRLRKTRCDQKFPSCTSCLKANVECVGIDAATGREIPRSYVSHLEDRVAQLELLLQKHGIPYDHSTPGTGETQPPAIFVSSEMDADFKGPSSSLSSPLDTPSIGNHQDFSKQSGSEVENLMSSVKMVSVKAATIPPVSYLGSSSGLSFARLLFTAVKFKSHDNSNSNSNTNTNANTPHNTNPNPSTHSEAPVGQKPYEVRMASLPSKPVAERLISIFFSLANAQLPIMHREQFLVKYFKPIYGSLSSDISLASDYTTIGVPVCSPSAPCESNTYYAKHYLNSAPEYSESKPAESPDDPSPESSKYNRVPIIDLESMNRPIPDSINPRESLPALFFLNIVFGIATSASHQHYPAQVSDSFRLAAMRHIDSVFSATNRLEALQGILLLALYSIMRPAVPGVWYVLGSAMRLCVDLGLHTEGGMKSWYKSSVVSASSHNPDLLSTSNQQTQNMSTQINLPEYDPATLDMRRRLFWCTYALDRQVCVYLGRPVGIPEYTIKVPFPSEIDDALIVDSSFGVPSQEVLDYSLEKSTSPSYKTISLTFFKIRKIQAEIQKVLYDCAPFDRQFSSLDEWRNDMANKLETWHNECPKSKKRMNCNFNLSFIELNYHQTKLLLFGLCPAYTSPHTLQHYRIIAESGEQVIKNYHELHHNKSINYTWVAVHNLFMAGTSYLYALYHSPDVRASTTVAEIDFNTLSCTLVLSSMIGRCDAAVSCRDTFQLLAAAILKLCYNEQSSSTMQRPSNWDINEHKDLNPILPANKFGLKTSSYVNAHVGSVIDTLPHPEVEIKLEPDLRGQHTNVQGPSSKTVPEPMGPIDSHHHVWPEDLDLFFQEAAQMDGISPNCEISSIDYSQQQPDMEQQPYLSTIINDSSHDQGSSKQNDSERTASPLSNQFDMSYISSDNSQAHRPAFTRNDGQRIYDIINEVPMASIWDQFFATSGSSGGSGSSGSSISNAMNPMAVPTPNNASILYGTRSDGRPYMESNNYYGGSGNSASPYA